MDARIDPAAAFGITLGDAHVIRNVRLQQFASLMAAEHGLGTLANGLPQAGGSAKDALRSIIISEQLLGTTEIVLVKHTGCGMLTFKNDDAYGVVEKNLGSEAAQELQGSKLDFLSFPKLEEAVEDDVKYLKGTKLVPDHVTITGWVYEVETGKTKQIV